MAEISGSDTDHRPDVDESDVTFNGDDLKDANSHVPYDKMEMSKEIEDGSSVDGAPPGQEQVTPAGDSSAMILEQITSKENILPYGPGGDGLIESEMNISVTSDDSTNVQPAEMKLKTDFLLSETLSTASIDSGKGGKTGSDCQSTTSSKPASTESASKTQEQKEKDALRREKDKEREDKIRIQREKLAEERQKKIEEMREQQRLAQEKRDKQLELRRMKIDELRRRDEERRAAVEERRKMQDDQDKARKEAIIQKSQLRLTRYEQWKAETLSKKGFFPGGSPPSKHLSVSTSVLYHKRNTNFSSTGNLSAKDRPESCLALNTIPEKRRSFLAPSGPPPTRPKSTVNLTQRGGDTVKLRQRTTPRKPRPASVAGSTPSFTQSDSTRKAAASAAASRSKSTDRLSRPRDRSKPRITPKKEKDEQNKQEKAAEKEKKDEKEKKKFEVKKPSTVEKKKPDQSKKDNKEESSTPEERKTTPKISAKTLERLSTPKTKPKQETPSKPEEKAPAKVVRRSILASNPMPPPRKTKGTPKQKEKDKKETPSKGDTGVAGVTPIKDSEAAEAEQKPEEEVTADKPAQEETQETSGKPLPVPIIQVDSPEKGQKDETPEISEKVAEAEVEEEGDTKDEDIQEITEAAPEQEEPLSTPAKADQKPPKADSKPKTPAVSAAESKPATPSSASSTPKSQKEQELEEYRAKLAERRRQAREKAEREAELERQRQEEIKRQEEEKKRREEEEQRKLEEEAQYLAELARKSEEERLQKAIEAEEERKRAEAERMEQERKAKEEAEKKAKEEAEKAERERIEKAKREEDERLERKKRLDMIMKRVKSDSPMTSSVSQENIRLSGSLATLSPSKNSFASTENITDDRDSDENGVTFTLEESSEDKGKSQTPSTESSKFKSPLLQKLVESKQSQNGGSETPKFKSPLLQSLLGRKGRLGLDKADSDSKSDGESLSDSEKNDTHPPTSEVNSGEVTPEQRPEDSPHGEVNMDENDSIESEENSDSRTEVMSESVTVIQSEDRVNGCVHNGEVHQELVDSSISMRTADSLGTSLMTDSSMCGSLSESQTPAASEPVSSVAANSKTNSEFEEYIDLNNKHIDLKSQHLGTNADDFINYNTTQIEDNLDNRESSDDIIPRPIIAFEDNATRRQEVSDYLS